MLTLDGSQGEGGGQILRSALALSMATGTPFRLHAIRAGRSKPGILRQHLAATLAAAKICDAQVDGAVLGSTELRFHPSTVRAGEYQFSVGSAGSASLVLQTVLPPLLTADAPSSLVIEGGTHNPHAPPVDFLQYTFLPVINRMGPQVTIDLKRHGFYPAAGGRFSVQIEPAARLQSLELTERGSFVRGRAYALLAGLPREIGDRELAVIGEQLAWPEEALQLRHLPPGHGPGNVLLLQVEFANHTEIFTGFGERRVSAEAVASHAASEARAYLKTTAVVGAYLADQLLLPFALAGSGTFTTLPPTEHTRTNLEVIKKFLDVNWLVEPIGQDVWQLTCRSGEEGERNVG